MAADDLDLARELLVAPEPLPLDDPDHDPRAPAPRASSRTRWLVLVAGLLAAALLFGRLLALAGAL